MSERYAGQRPRKGCQWRLLLAVLVLVLGAIFWLRMSWRADLEDVQAIATRLGDAPDTHLRWLRRCWETYPFGGYCTVDVHFSTALSQEEFSQLVQEKPGDLTFISRGRSQGTLLFTDFGSGSLSGEPQIRITADGDDGTSIKRPSPNAYEWEFKDNKERSIYIRFYDIINAKEEYRLDNEVFKHNIITIQLKL